MKTVIIKTLYKNILRPAMFLSDPEEVHDGMTRMGKLLGSNPLTKALIRMMFFYEHPSLKQTVAGITFANPIGLSAGFDKDANLINILPDVGFGYMQVGTVTYKPYKGNPKPRLYRLPKSRGIVVNYGLKNDGVHKIIKKISCHSEGVKRLKNPLRSFGRSIDLRMTNSFPISISIGKTNCKETAAVKAGIKDYYECLRTCIKENVGDFYTINISCPNTFSGEPFTTADKLDKLLKKLYTLKIVKPVFLKMPINTAWQEFEKLLDIAVKYKVTGVIIGNLNKDRKAKDIKDMIPKNIKGSVSGKPTWSLSNELIYKTYKAYGKKLVIVGVGGVFCPKDAYEKIKRGATLVQLITGMIYEGPQLIGEINQGLVKLLKEDGHSHISEAVGRY